MVRLRKKQSPPPPPPPPPRASASANSPDPKTTTSTTSTELGMPGSSASGLRVGGAAGSWSIRTQWIFFAVASGACAAFNGVFAKLTTTNLTTSLSKGIAETFGLSSMENIVEYAVRGMFFALNLIFNGVMWSLFTTALARGTSTTQVSIMNTSTNFIITAFMGWLIFSEALPAMWWAGAALLVAGNVIIGRKDETKEGAPGQQGDGYVPVARADGDDGLEAARKDSVDEDIIDLGDLHEEERR